MDHLLSRINDYLKTRSIVIDFSQSFIQLSLEQQKGFVGALQYASRQSQSQSQIDQKRLRNRKPKHPQQLEETVKVLLKNSKVQALLSVPISEITYASLGDLINITVTTWKKVGRKLGAVFNPPFSIS
jgi:hypothetical protein